MQQIINSSTMLKVGTMLRGVYRIDSYLSSGGFGNTYVATNVEFAERYAIKEFFMKGLSQRDENQTTVSVSNFENTDSFYTQKEKFKKEARRLRQLHNEHIMQVHDLFEENGTAYYVMDYVDGENLNEQLKRTEKPFTEDEINKILPQILDALQTVHNAGIWHLDLKPANILMDKNENIKLIDFGASKQMDSDKGGATTSTAISYTNGYAPREQMEQNYEKFGPWTDFYALGATLYTLLTGKRPPLPTDIDDDQTENKHIALPIPVNVSFSMRKFVLLLMNTNRLLRPKSVSEIKAILEHEISEDDENTIIELNAISRERVIPKKTHEENSIHHYKDGIWKFLPWALGISILVVAIFLYASNHKSSGEAGLQEKASAVVKDSIAASRLVSDYDVTLALGRCKYSGMLNENALPTGTGIAHFDDGRYYKGTFINGNLEGENVFFSYKEGDVFEGSFKNNQFEKGKYTIKSSGECFVGTYKNGNPLHGKWYDKNGNILENI